MSNSLQVVLQPTAGVSASITSSKDDKPEMAAKPSNPPKAQKPDSTSVPYPSPPNSPRQAKAHNPVVPKPAGTVSCALSPPTALRHLSASTAPEKKPAENEFNASTLRTRLGLDEGRCGGPKKDTRGPCRNWSPAANKGPITSQLEAMTGLTQASPELRSALDKLAMLVHCKHHDNGLPKKARLEVWTTKFPLGQADADRAALVEKRIRRLLDLESTRCIGIASSTRSRCKNGIGGQRVQNCARTIDEIVKPDIHLDDSFLDGLLKVLETNMHCHYHVNKHPPKMVASWKSSIVGIRGEQPIESAGSSAPEGARNPARAPNTQEPESPATKPVDGLASRSRDSLTPNFDRDLSTCWPAAYDTSPFDIIERSNRLSDYKSSYAQVKSEMTKEFEEEDLKPGYLYAYEVEGNKGFVKIGYTNISVEKRHSKWNFDCNRLSKAVYPVPSVSFGKVEHAHRVEQLCHAELRHRWIRIYCKGCLKQHREWFEVSHAEAIAVIQKWSKWMGNSPYKAAENRWALRDEEVRRVEDMDRFMTELSLAQPKSQRH